MRLLHRRTMNRCQFKLDTDPTYECPYPLYYDRRGIFNVLQQFCVFHYPKISEAEKETHIQSGWAERIEEIQHNENEFRDKFFDLLKNAEADARVTMLDFRGFRLPSIDLRGTVFHKPVSFQEAHFVQEPKLNAMVFEKPADFSKVKFDTTANFFGVRFNEKADFSGGTFKGDPNFIRCIRERSEVPRRYIWRTSHVLEVSV